MSHPCVGDGPQGTSVEWHPEDPTFTVTVWQGYSPKNGEANRVVEVVFRADEEARTLSVLSATVRSAYSQPVELVVPGRAVNNHIARTARRAAAEWSGERYWRIR